MRSNRYNTYLLIVLALGLVVTLVLTLLGIEP